MNELVNNYLACKSPHTARCFRTIIKQFQASLGERSILETNPVDCTRYFASIANKADNTIRHLYHTLAGFFEFLIDIGKLNKNPIKACRRMISQRHRTLVRPTHFIETGTILKALAQATGDDRAQIRDLAMLSLFFGGGLRRAEIWQLNCGDFKKTQSGNHYIFLYRTKSGREQKQALPEWAWLNVERLLEQREDEGAQQNDPILINYRGYRGKRKRLAIETIARIFKRYFPDASCHSAQATYATTILSQGTYEEAALGLRHGDTQMVKVYDKRLNTVDNSPALKVKYVA